MPNEERGRLDHAIDRAVRGLMQVDPAPGLRQRVAGRIEAGVRRSWTVPAFAAAAVAVLIVAVVLLQSPEVVPVPEPKVASALPGTPVEAPPAPQKPAEIPQPAPPPASAPETRASQARTAKPSAESIFGERTGRVTAANVAQADQAQPKPGESAAPQKAEPGAQPVNIKLDLTFTDYSGPGEPVRKVVTVVVADRGAGSIRTAGSVRNQGRVQINVDARPQILESGVIRLTLALEYSPRSGNDGPAESSTLNEQITTIVEPGKPLLVSQAADPASDRRITVEVKASVMK